MLVGARFPRVVALFIDTVVFSVAAATRRHQRIGDIVAGTVAVDARNVSLPPLTRRRTRVAMAVGAVVALLGSSLAIEYFGQPPLVIQGILNTSHSPGWSHVGFGNPVWTLGQATYPITSVGTNPCSGELTLHWNGPLRGWSQSTWSWSCILGHPAGQ